MKRDIGTAIRESLLEGNYRTVSGVFNPQIITSEENADPNDFSSEIENRLPESDHSEPIRSTGQLHDAQKSEEPAIIQTEQRWIRKVLITVAVGLLLLALILGPAVAAYTSTQLAAALQVGLGTLALIVGIWPFFSGMLKR